MAELYDEYFYDRVAAHPRIALSELKIQPPDGPKDFYPRKHNVHRTAKVPSLIINATTLNSGRNWQFSVVDAGEHEDGKAQEQRQSDDYDKSVLFRAFRYDAKGIPDKYRKIPLSVAVAASACVPGIFPPLALTGLYPNATPKLVDGGVFDNQGTSALLYEKCTDILISDASGQMDDEAKPPSSLLSVLLRTNSISMDRIRDSGFLRLSELGKSGALSRYISFHLKEDFGVDKLDPGQYKKEPKELAVQNPISYGINGEAQLQLAKIRTDLDSFTEIESRSLMYSGYAIAKQRVPGDWQDVFSSKKDFMKKIHRRQQQVWDFEEVRSHLEKPFEDAEFSRQLSIGRETMFKAFRLMPRLIPLGVLIGLIAVIGPLLLLGALWYGISFFSLWDFVIGIVVLSMVSGAVAAAVSTRWLRVLWEDFVLQIIVTSAAALFGSLAAKLHLRWIDPKFVAQGTLDRIGASRRE